MMKPYSWSLKIDSLLVYFGVIAWISVFAGTVLPGVIAAQYQVFYKTELERQIVRQNVQPAAEILNQKKVLSDGVGIIDLAISKTLLAAKDSAEVKNLVALRHGMQDELSRLNDRIVVAPFFLNDLMFAWSAMYIAIATLIFIVLPKIDGGNTTVSWKIALAVATIYPLYQGPVWLRNFVLSNEQRRVYGFANYDICPASFWMQEINTVIWLVLVAFLWQRLFLIYKQRCSELACNANAPPDANSLTQLSDTFLNWQVSSIILALGFIVFTEVFWGLVIVSKDRRYLLPAVVVHVIWGLSWMLVTLPMFATWNDFSRKKMRAILTSQKNGLNGVRDDPEALDKLSPIALWNGFGSAFVALVSFIFPIVHALIK